MIAQSTQFVVLQMSITNRDGTVENDIRGIYQELNIHDNMMMPCMSGSILLYDAVGLSSKLKFDGSQYLSLKIIKDSEHPDELTIDKKFVIYKQTNRSLVNQTTEMYILNFVSEEFIYSQQKKIRQSFSGTYSDMVYSILVDYMLAENNIGTIETTRGIRNYIASNTTPIDTIENICKRSVNEKGLPDFMFWETKEGYNFMSLSTLINENVIANIEFGVKNLGEESSTDLFGARDIKVISQFDMSENVHQGAYAGRFIGYDTLTRTIQIRDVSLHDIYEKTNHANENSMNAGMSNKENKSAHEMFDSRVTLYPFQSSKIDSPWFKQKVPDTLNSLDDSEEYILQRKSIFQNLLQRKLRIVMPGNFGFSSGYMVNLNVPNRSNDGNDEPGDKSLTGKYIITGTRHTIRADKHETILEVATDSTNLGT